MARIQYIPNRVIDANGISDGARVYLLQSGSSTPVPLFQDPEFTTAIPNPIVVPTGAEVPVFYTSYEGNLRLRVVEYSGVVSMDEDPYSPPLDQISLSAGNGASLIGTADGGNVQEGLDYQVNQTSGIVSVLNYGAKGDGVTNDSSAFQDAVNALPDAGGVVDIPSGFRFVLDQGVETGEKKVAFRLGQSTIIGPRGDFLFKLQSNGSSLRGCGRLGAILQLRGPVSPVVFPAVTLARVGGSITSATPSGGSGIVSTPVVIIGDSPAASVSANEAATVAYVNGGTVTNMMPQGQMSAQGSGYTSTPDINWLGGGAGAVLIDNVQACSVGDFSIDFQDVQNSTGVVHRGGWWADVSNIDAVYNTATGVTSEHASTVGLVIDSYTLGAPGSTGGYGGVYVSRYRNLFFSKRFIVGHDTSTATTLQFDTCDFKNNFIHASIGVVEVNPVNQSNIGDFYHLVNVDGLTLVGGDFEGSSRWFHVYGSCNNIRVLNTLAYVASGERVRGPIGVGWLIDPAKSNEGNPLNSFPLRTGSLSAGADFQNSGFRSRHRHGITWDGDVFLAGATNCRPISATEVYLDDVTKSATFIETTTSGQVRMRRAAPNNGAQQVPSVEMVTIGDGGLNIGSGSNSALMINGQRVVGPRGAAISNPSDAASTMAAVISILNQMRDDGKIAT